MSRLQDLIERYCPDGVEYKTLGEVGEFLRGSSFQKKHFVEDGTPCIHYGQVHTRFNIATDVVVSYLDESFAKKMKRAEPGDLIIATTAEDDEAVGKAIAWLGDVEVVVSNDAYIYRHELDPKYMAYIFASDLFQEPKRQYITGTKVRRLNEKGMSKIVIPVPPIEVQREVVRILDEYTAAHDELARQLEDEVRLREQQLTIARNELMAFNDMPSLAWATLGEITLEVITPIRAKPTDFTGEIPWCKLEDVVGRSIGKSLSGKGVSRNTIAQMHLNITPKGTLLCSCSATLGVYAIAETDLVTNQRFMGFVLSEEVCKEYVLHYLRYATPALSNRATGSTNAYISRKKFENLSIPLPPLEIQEDYARILDSLEDELQNLNSALELEMQRHASQLTLVRNQLLSFPEKAA